MMEAKCLFCETTIKGERDYMLKGVGLRMDGRRKPKWLKILPEFKWAWNGLSDIIDGKRYSAEFYLCPNHTDDEHYDMAFKWAQEQIDGQKALSELIV